MDELFKSNSFHHAYFLIGDKDVIRSKLNLHLEKRLKIKIYGNPDFLNLDYKTLSIDEARFVGEMQGKKSERQIFIISADFITTEAQNSLLKILEEPTAGTHFFFISPQDLLLPTLRSRMHVILVESEAKEIESILRLKIPKRLEIVKEITEAISDEEKTKQDAISLLNQIETELHSEGTVESFNSLRICELTRASLYDRGAPIKMILENLMLSI